MADLSVYSKLGSLQDYLDVNRKANLEGQMAQQEMLMKQQKLQQIDVDKLGEMAFMKAAQGLPLTPQEHAAAQFIDAKSGGIQFDPVTGAKYQKPRISERIGLPDLPNMQPRGIKQALLPQQGNDNAMFADSPMADGLPQLPDVTPRTAPPPMQISNAPSYDKFEQIRKEALINPKMRQENLKTFSKSIPPAEQIKTTLGDYSETFKQAGTLEKLASAMGLPTNLSSAYTRSAMLAKGEELFNLGVLNGADLVQLQSALADPRTFKGAFSPSDTVSKQSEEMQSMINEKLAGTAAGAGLSYNPPKKPLKGEAEFKARKAGLSQAEIDAYKREKGL